jgi:hypothetical protein
MVLWEQVTLVASLSSAYVSFGLDRACRTIFRSSRAVKDLVAPGRGKEFALVRNLSLSRVYRTALRESLNQAIIYGTLCPHSAMEMTCPLNLGVSSFPLVILLDISPRTGLAVDRDML